MIKRAKTSLNVRQLYTRVCTSHSVVYPGVPLTVWYTRVVVNLSQLLTRVVVNLSQLLTQVCVPLTAVLYPGGCSSHCCAIPGWYSSPAVVLPGVVIPTCVYLRVWLFPPVYLWVLLTLTR